MDYAIVGATNDPKKYGYKVLKGLMSMTNVVPINPKQKKILGLDCFSTLSEAIKSGKKIKTVVFVVPPNITEKILKEVFNLGIKNVWFQPGSESKKAIGYCKKNNIEETHNSCLLIINDIKIPK